jgi:parallel beta-helix repeat protein
MESINMLKMSVFMVSLLLVAMPLTDVYTLAIYSSTPTLQNSPSDLIISAETPHGPIVINGDANFSDTALIEGWPGNGSSENPFIIDRLYIDLGGGAGHCINISATRVNFTIQNCNLTAASSGAGIFLDNVSFGYLFNNTCTFNGHGIYLLQSTYNVLENNTCLSNGRGVYMYESDFNTVTSNDCDDNSNYGIFLQLCDSNVIFNNQCSSTGTNGIGGQSVVSNTFANNTCNQNYRGIRLWDYSSGNNVVNNTCNHNSEAGIWVYNNNYALPLYVTNNYCSDNDYGIDVAGTFVFVMNNILVDNELHGIIAQCSDSVISQNTILRSDRAIYLNHFDYSTVSQNQISTSSIGIYMMECGDNTISENFILDNYEAGISIEQFSYENTIFLNDISIDTYYDPFEFWGIRIDSHSDYNNLTMNYLLFEYNIDSVGIEDNGGSNLIDRNWYEDYDDSYDENGYGYTPYSIPGSAGNSDPRPLEYSPHAPEWTELPTDQVIDYWGQSFYYDLNASAPSPITWSVNDTIQFTIDSNGVLQTLSDLPVDSYWVKVRVTNIYGLYITGVFCLIVQEVSLPEWIVGPTDFALIEGNTFNEGLIVTDESGILSWSLNNTFDFSLTIEHLNVSGYNFGWYLLQITNATFLGVGHYPLNVTVVDPYGNVLSGVFIVTVYTEATDTTPPIWISIPTEQVLPYGNPLTLQLAAWDASGISYGWVNDTVHFYIDENWILRNASVLESGIYKLEVRMFDLFDNFCTTNFTVTILDVPTTTTSTITTPITGSTSTTTTTPNSSQPTTPLDGLFPMMPFVLGIGLGGGIVVIAVLAMSRKLKLNG